MHLTKFVFLKNLTCPFLLDIRHGGCEVGRSKEASTELLLIINAAMKMYRFLNQKVVRKQKKKHCTEIWNEQNQLQQLQ